MKRIGKASTMLVFAVIVTFSSTNVCAQKSKSQVVTLSRGDTIRIVSTDNNSSGGISNSGVMYWPNWVKTQTDTNQFLAMQLMDQKKAISELKQTVSVQGATIKKLKLGQDTIKNRVKKVEDKINQGFVEDSVKIANLQLDIAKMSDSLRKELRDSSIAINVKVDQNKIQSDANFGKQSKAMNIANANYLRGQKTLDSIKIRAKIKREKKVQKELKKASRNAVVPKASQSVDTTAIDTTTSTDTSVYINTNTNDTIDKTLASNTSDADTILDSNDYKNLAKYIAIFQGEDDDPDIERFPLIIKGGQIWSDSVIASKEVMNTFLINNKIMVDMKIIKPNGHIKYFYELGKNNILSTKSNFEKGTVLQWRSQIPTMIIVEQYSKKYRSKFKNGML